MSLNKIQKPMFRWAGGKQRLINKLIKYIPNDFNNYYEPFLGAGSMFFAISGHLYNKNREYHLSDSNKRLIRLYLDVINTPKDEIFNTLEYYRDSHSRDFFHSVKNNNNMNLIMLYILKACFNGLYRVNKKGEFNTSYNPDDIRFDYETIYNCKDILCSNNVYLDYSDFNFVTPDKNDLLYLDPPYFPINQKSNFSSYTKDGFNIDSHLNLLKYFNVMNDNKVKIMMSNSDCEFNRENYKDFNIKEIEVRRSLAGNAKDRKIVKELIITNYDC